MLFSILLCGVEALLYGLVDLEGKDEVVKVVLGEADPQAPGELLLE